MVKLVEGTIYIPGIGKLVLAGTLLYLGAKLITTIGQATYDQIVSWMNDKYNSVIDDAVDSIDHKKVHILKDKHNWTRLVPGSPRDPNF